MAQPHFKEQAVHATDELREGADRFNINQLKVEGQKNLGSMRFISDQLTTATLLPFYEHGFADPAYDEQESFVSLWRPTDCRMACVPTY